MPDKKDLIERAKELGYKHQRTTKHGDLWKHPITGARIQIPGTPGDYRGLKNCAREIERGAVTDGHGHERLAEGIATDSSLIDAVRTVVKRSGVPMRMSEIADAVTKAIPDANRNSLSVTASTLAKKHEEFLRLKRGWYVWDEELGKLPGPARRTAIDQIADIGPRRAYRSGALRREALDLGREIAGLPPLSEPQPTSETEAEDSRAVLEKTARPEPTNLMEVLSIEDEVAALRDEDGRLWIARPLAKAVIR